MESISEIHVADAALAEGEQSETVQSAVDEAQAPADNAPVEADAAPAED